MRRAGLSWLLVAATSCASLEPTTTVRPIDRDLLVGALADTTRFEREGKAASSDDGLEGQPDKSERNQRARTGVFWAGIGALAIGVAGTIGLAVGGEISQRQLDKGYDDGDLTRSRDDELRDRGETMNKASIGTIALGVIGLAMAAVAYGLDYTNCGTLAKRRRDCTKRR